MKVYYVFCGGEFYGCYNFTLYKKLKNLFMAVDSTRVYEVYIP